MPTPEAKSKKKGYDVVFYLDREFSNKAQENTGHGRDWGYTRQSHKIQETRP